MGWDPSKDQIEINENVRVFHAVKNHFRIFKVFKKIDLETEFHGKKNIIIKTEEDFLESNKTHEQAFEYCNNPQGPRIVVLSHTLRSVKRLANKNLEIL